jgi:hypothetical protein
MSEGDGELFDLIQEITEHGMVFYLELVLDHWGRPRAKRLIEDQFAVVRPRGSNLDDDNFVPSETALVLIEHLRKTDEYVFMAAPWAPVDPEWEPELVARYTADDPDAVSEVRRRNDERRAKRWA